MTELKLQNAEIGYRLKKGSKILLHNINISTESGDLIALIGVNGSGKSTLLRSITGLHDLLSGSVSIKGINQVKYNKTELAKTIAFVSSEIIQTKYLKVKDLVALGRYPHQTFGTQNSEEDEKIVDASLHTVGMSNFKNQYLTEISDGERQKIMTARALAQNTDIILADEPAAFLDLENKFALYKIFSDTVKKSNKTIIFSTHDLNIALKYCDKVWLIKDKKIIEGSPEDLILTGLLQNIFTDKHIIFNSETFEFSVKKEKKYPINIINRSENKTLELLIINAFERNSYYVSDKTDIPAVEIINVDKFKLKINLKLYEVSTIYSLLKMLNK